MSLLISIFATIAVLAGAFFFIAGTLGLLRFGDTLSRVHALTKADNLGLGLIVLGRTVFPGASPMRLANLNRWVSTAIVA